MNLFHSPMVASRIRRRRGSIAQDFLYVPDTDKIVDVIREGEVFRADSTLLPLCN